MTDKLDRLRAIRDEMARLDALKAERAELVRRLSDAGDLTQTAIADAAGLTRMDVWRIVKKDA